MSGSHDPTVEIELKFLVASDDWPRAPRPVRIDQGYLSTDPDRVVRVRLRDDEAFLTVKGRATGGVRREFEYPVPAAHARDMLELCGARRVTKDRHVVEVDGFTWEIDHFLGDNAGLIVAEVEVDREERLSEVRRSLPAWVGDEVTEDPRFANSELALRPYGTWSDASIS